LKQVEQFWGLGTARAGVFLLYGYFFLLFYFFQWKAGKNWTTLGSRNG